LFDNLITQFQAIAADTAWQNIWKLCDAFRAGSICGAIERANSNFLIPVL